MNTETETRFQDLEEAVFDIALLLAQACVDAHTLSEDQADEFVDGVMERLGMQYTERETTAELVA